MAQKVSCVSGSGGSRAREKKTNSEKGGGVMVEVGRRREGASPPKPIVGSKRSWPRKKKIQLRIWERRDVVVGGEGRGNEPTQADARL